MGYSEILMGVDIGGSFTDMLVLDAHRRIRICKTPSTPEQPEKAIANALSELGIDPRHISFVMHGTTIATNALLEGKGAKTAYISNYGFADTLSIARQSRAQLYQLKPLAKNIPVAKELCFEVGGRMTPQGEVLSRPDDQEIATIARKLAEMGVESVALNLLFSFIDNGFEQYIAERLAPQYSVSCGSLLHPAPGEYERGIVSWVNARVTPLMEAYLKKLNILLPNASIQVMQSHGHTIPAQRASQYSVNLLLSGPAAGVMAVKNIAEVLDESKILSFDMGGTSTDISVIDEDIKLTHHSNIGGWPIAVPMIDIQTIGAGGGSIAFVDEAGLLRLGPESAGSTPGPACYCRGGERPTVTDANFILGRIPATLQQLTLSIEKSRAAFLPLCETLNMEIEELAQGVVDLANEQMIQTLRKTLTAKNHYAGDFLLCGFGAAAGLHICALAEGLKIKRAIVPPHAGVLSAWGLLTASRGAHSTQSIGAVVEQITEAEIYKVQKELKGSVLGKIDYGNSSELTLRYFAELRYQGQLFCLNLMWQGLAKTENAFHAAHQQQYGHRLDHPVELVALRVEACHHPLIDHRELLEASVAQEGLMTPEPHLRQKQKLDHAITVVDANCTVWIPKDWEAWHDAMGNLRLQQT